MCSYSNFFRPFNHVSLTPSCSTTTKLASSSKDRFTARLEVTLHIRISSATIYLRPRLQRSCRFVAHR
uniref:Uncharacterized protein n=1 Tax=Physcomitrium patens TaxID=3218 RepID=A0A2K1JMY7_PHYPA|nr:hypothetical protein PHYPA_017736 [Physcomitrium patens]